VREPGGGGILLQPPGDLPDLPLGAKIQIHGPHGHFVLKEPITDSILIATARRGADARATCKACPADGTDRSGQGYLVYATRYESDIYYREEFEALASLKPKFHYLPTLSRAEESWAVCAATCRIMWPGSLRSAAARLGQPLPYPARSGNC